MAIPVFDPSPRPSPGTAHKPTVNLLAAEFGDGYTQAAAKGLNHIRRTVTLKWDALLLAEFQQLDAFFVERGGYKPFRYIVHGDGVSRRWTCREFSGANEAGYFVYTATLIEDFGSGTG